MLKQTLFFSLYFLCLAASVSAHGIHYRVNDKGISARFFYSQNNPASYTQYEIFGPGDSIAHKTGRTDKNGFASFLPDRAGKWVIKVFGESDHGMHGKTVEITVNDGLFLESYKKPFVAQHITAFVGLSLILFLFSLWVLLGRKMKTKK